PALVMDIHGETKPLPHPSLVVPDGRTATAEPAIRPVVAPQAELDLERGTGEHGLRPLRLGPLRLVRMDHLDPGKALGWAERQAGIGRELLTHVVAAAVFPGGEED